MKNKYNIGDLVWDKSYQAFGIITEVIKSEDHRSDEPGFDWGYYLKWFEESSFTNFEYELNISRHPDKNLLLTETIPF
tara:strand:- start:357 stop:590 length:234 start_codon:yes stop_codon:yes gene_type:complete